ncbi:hypothetical protein ACU8KH_03306 [Lachancea thermotolerans]
MKTGPGAGDSQILTAVRANALPSSYNIQSIIQRAQALPLLAYSYSYTQSQAKMT